MGTRGWGCLLAGLLAVGGCDAAQDEVVTTDDVADLAGGKEDGFGAIELAPGDGLEVEVRRHDGGSITPEHMAAFRVLAPADAPPDAVVALVARRQRGDGFDPYLELFADGESVAVSKFDQAILPMAAEPDAVVVWRVRPGTTYVAVAGDLELGVDGTFRADLVRLDTALPDFDLSRTNAGSRALTQALRELEPAVDAALVAGTLTEDDGGLVKTRLVDVPLAKRAELQRLAAEVNDVRAQLYDWVADGAAPVDRERVASLLPALWSALRSDAHRPSP